MGRRGPDVARAFLGDYRRLPGQGSDVRKLANDTQEPPLPITPHPYSGPRFAGLRVGLFGGSFNPAHAGHRFVSLFALRALALDQVWWMVSPQNPLKSPKDMASLDLRLRGARAVARHPRIVVTDIETRLGTRYTADTLAELTKRFPKTRFVWMMGADNLIQMPRWQHWRRIFRMVPVAVFARPSYSMRALGGMAARRYARRRVKMHRARGLAGMKPPAWAFLRNPLHPASATAIRRARALRVETQANEAPR